MQVKDALHAGFFLLIAGNLADARFLRSISGYDVDVSFHNALIVLVSRHFLQIVAFKGGEHQAVTFSGLEQGFFAAQLIAFFVDATDGHLEIRLHIVAVNLDGVSGATVPSHEIAVLRSVPILAVGAFDVPRIAIGVG